MGFLLSEQDRPSLMGGPNGLKPRHSPNTRSMATGETGGQEITPRRSFPIQHLSRTKYPWQRAYHQSRIQGFKRNSARRTDGFLQRARRDEPDRKRFDCRPEQRRVGKVLFGHTFSQKARFHPYNTDPALEMARHRA